MRTKTIGRLLRSRPATARLLTEYRAATMPRMDRYADLHHCLQSATRGSTAIDVGASVGNYSLALSKAVGPGGRVLAFEANPTVFSELVNSTWCSRVTPLNLAVSSTSGWAAMLVPGFGREVHEPLGTLEARSGQHGRTFQVRCVRLDDLVDAARVVSVIKVDVEGHEAEVLVGAEETIDRHHPTFVMEIEQRHLVDRNIADVVQQLVGQGYDCSGIKGKSLVPWAEFDVHRYQTRWLEKTSGFQEMPAGEYVNNFLFRYLR